MTAVTDIATAIDRPARPTERRVFERPAELVDIAERLYRQIFAVGLWVAVTLSGFAALSALLQPTAGSQLRGFVVCSVVTAGCVLAATRPAEFYAALRRQPWWLSVAGAVLGVGAWFVGVSNFELFLPIIAVIGVLGIATPWRTVLAAGVVAAIGLGAPQLLDGEGNLGGPIAVLVPPLLFWLIVERIAGFALRLHQSLPDAPNGAEPAEATSSDADRPRPEPAPAPFAGDHPMRALAAPPVIEVDGVRLTSRQLQVILLACEGLQHAAIGGCLDIGVPMVRRHLATAQRRTGSTSTPQLVAWARRAGLVPGSFGNQPRA